MPGSTVCYIPYSRGYPRPLWSWIARTLELDLTVLDIPADVDLNRPIDLPARSTLAKLLAPYLHFPHVIVEGPGGLLWASVLRALGFRGAFTAVAHVNPTSWHDVKAIALFCRFLAPTDRLYVGSSRSADLYRRLGLPAVVGHPYGIDCEMFAINGDARTACRALGIGAGPLIVFAGRLEADKCVHTLIRVAIKARLLFPNLQLAIASSIVDPAYEELLADAMSQEWVFLIRNPAARTLAALYGAADAFVTAATSEYETFGRAPVEAMACGATAIAPRYDGFCETLAQPGGILIDLAWSADDVAIDEFALLRALYERLTSPERAPRSAISSAVRARFSRDQTITMLAHLAAAPAPSPQRMSSDFETFALPDEWSKALAAMRRQPRQESVDWVLAWQTNLELCDADSTFRRSVRRALAGFAA